MRVAHVVDDNCAEVDIGYVEVALGIELGTDITQPAPKDHNLCLLIVV